MHIPYVSTRKITFSSPPRHHLNRKTRIFTFVLLFRNPSHHANSPSRSPSFTIPMAPRSGHLPPHHPNNGTATSSRLDWSRTLHFHQHDSLFFKMAQVQFSNTEKKMRTPRVRSKVYSAPECLRKINIKNPDVPLQPDLTPK